VQRCNLFAAPCSSLQSASDLNPLFTAFSKYFASRGSSVRVRLPPPILLLIFQWLPASSGSPWSCGPAPRAQTGHKGGFGRHQASAIGDVLSLRLGYGTSWSSADSIASRYGERMRPFAFICFMTPDREAMRVTVSTHVEHWRKAIPSLTQSQPQTGRLQDRDLDGTPMDLEVPELEHS
jgi:hypothetical protein